MVKLKQELKQALDSMKTVKNDITKEDIYICIVETIKEQLQELPEIVSDRKLYYISAEFLLGKMLTSNLINLGVLDEVKAFTTEQGFAYADIQEVEKEPSLGNGGLGRLAACFLDSIAALNLCGDGIGLYYHYGLFEQQFQDFKQVEVPNEWIQGSSWFEKKEVDFEVTFPNMTLHPILYDMDVAGYHGKKNRLHLFDVADIDESIVQEGIIFDKKDIEKNLTLFLYPDDSDDDGRLLRIYQQYFMVSCGAQMILADCEAKGYDLHELHGHVIIQINDTHPSMVIPELIRLLMKKGILMKEAISIVEKTCAYTNHTILAEALETWPIAYLRQVVPDLLPIIEALDTLIDRKSDEPKVQIIDEEQRVHMAHMDIHFGKSVNGVAAIHTQILKESELQDFYAMYPDKFNNKTNGITFRRWLYACNPELTDFLVRLLGKDVLEQPALLKNLLAYQEDEQVLYELVALKQEKKRQFIKHMEVKQGLHLNANAIFDTQVKRMHEYKRQQMNALYIIHKYLEIKSGIYPKRPIACIFGAKAAPAYEIAKDIIHVLLCLQEILAKDEAVAPYLQLCFIENYNITEAEIVIPASDISEQISLASKEASGTGNMKFMLNGALTLGTRDGANVEIAELVKEDNIYIFGESSEQVIAHYAKHDYCAATIYEEDAHIKELVNFLTGEKMLNIGDEDSLQRFSNELIHKDWFMTLLDVKDYIACKERMLDDYENRLSWSKKMLVNIANSAFFSSDRTIEEYNRDIWHLTEGGNDET